MRRITAAARRALPPHGGRGLEGGETIVWQGENQMIDKFTGEVCKKLGCYVYRLIDPRDGSTFYVGKGTGNRVKMHILLFYEVKRPPILAGANCKSLSRN